MKKIIAFLLFILRFFIAPEIAIAGYLRKEGVRSKFPNWAGKMTSPAHLSLNRTNRTNNLGNPIYSLKGYADGAKQLQVDAVSGTAKTQRRDRNIGGNFAPLPDGKYEVGSIERRKIRAIGGTFIHIKPAFKTSRTELGIHWNPGFNQRGKRDGTAGCIGITSRNDRDRVNRFVRKYRVKRLVVKIARY